MGHRVTLCVIPPKELVERCHAMALDQSALLEVLDALKAADVGDRVRAAAETVYQALIEAELTDSIGAALHERSDCQVPGLMEAGFSRLDVLSRDVLGRV